MNDPNAGNLFECVQSGQFSIYKPEWGIWYQFIYRCDKIEEKTPPQTSLIDFLSSHFIFRSLAVQKFVRYVWETDTLHRHRAMKSISVAIYTGCQRPNINIANFNTFRFIYFAQPKKSIRILTYLVACQSASAAIQFESHKTWQFTSAHTHTRNKECNQCSIFKANFAKPDPPPCAYLITQLRLFASISKW